jgi:hypothetical protein
VAVILDEDGEAPEEALAPFDAGFKPFVVLPLAAACCCPPSAPATRVIPLGLVAEQTNKQTVVGCNNRIRSRTRLCLGAGVNGRYKGVETMY